LINALIDDANSRGLKGLTVGATVWDHMPKSFFAKYGFVDTDEKADSSRMNLKLLVSEEPQFPPKENLYKPQLVQDKVVIDLIRTGNCPTIYQTHDLVKRAAARFGDKLVVNEYATSEKDVIERFGNGGCGTYMNGKSAFFGYPGELEEIVEFLKKKVEDILVKGPVV
jgi:hypothetical protein